MMFVLVVMVVLTIVLGRVFGSSKKGKGYRR